MLTLRAPQRVQLARSAALCLKPELDIPVAKVASGSPSQGFYSLPDKVSAVQSVWPEVAITVAAQNVLHRVSEVQ
jgi:hypothetical protein